MHNLTYFILLVLVPLIAALATPEPFNPGFPPLHCCTLTTKIKFPTFNPREYMALNCKYYAGNVLETLPDDFNQVWRTECHHVITPPWHLHEELFGINCDCKVGADACV